MRSSAAEESLNVALSKERLVNILRKMLEIRFFKEKADEHMVKTRSRELYTCTLEKKPIAWRGT